MYQTEIKVGIFGGKNCSKSLITLRFMQDAKHSGYDPSMKEDQQSKIIKIDNQEVKISIIDTSGIEDMSEIRFSYYNQAQAFVFVFDVEKPESLDSLYKIYSDVQSVKDDLICVVAANHSKESSGNSSTESYKEIENKLKCKVFETSTKTGKNINELFEHLARRLKPPSNKPKLRYAANSNTSAPLFDQTAVDPCKRRASLFAKRSTKKKPGKDPLLQAPIDNQAANSGKLIDDLKDLALAKANQLKSSLLRNKELENEVEQLKNNVNLLEQQNKQYLEKIASLEKQLERKAKNPNDSNKSAFETKLPIIDNQKIQKLVKKKVIGRGSISVVKKVSLDQEFALKSYDSDIFTKKDSGEDSDIQESIRLDKAILEDFVKQYEIVNNINNPYIAKALGFSLGDESNPPSILLEYYPYNLKNRVERLTDQERVSIIYEISKAMNDIHNNKIIHFGLNPGNILLDSNMHVKLSDFGFSTLFKDGSPLIGKTQISGSGQFMAPELLLCEGDCTEKVDVFAFGALMYYILTKGKYLAINDNGKIPISSPINDFARNLIRRCCSKLANQRPTFAEIIENIEYNQLIDEIDTSSIK